VTVGVGVLVGVIVGVTVGVGVLVGVIVGVGVGDTDAAGQNVLSSNDNILAFSMSSTLATLTHNTSFIFVILPIILR
jgi:hypothetical protein